MVDGRVSEGGCLVDKLRRRFIWLGDECGQDPLLQSTSIAVGPTSTWTQERIDDQSDPNPQQLQDSTGRIAVLLTR